MIGHLGSRASALLDGQLPAAESERAWAHVHQCHLCRDLVEREGWIKTRLAGLSFDGGGAPDRLKGSLLCGPDVAPMSAGDVYLTAGATASPRRSAGFAAIGGGAVGAAVMGVLALGAAPASAPAVDRVVPASVSSTSPAFVGPAIRQVAAVPRQRIPR